MIFHAEYDELPDMVPRLYTTPPTNGREDMRWSEVGDFGDFSEFDGSVDYDSLSQGYDTTATPIEFASGFQVRRKLFDDDQYHIMDQRPANLANAGNRTRQKHAARPFNNGFSVDSYFYNNTEGVAMCSASHTTTSGASTASGFDNLSTSALSATAFAAARIQMKGFRNDRGGRISVMPNELMYPVGLYETAWEIINSQGKLDTGDNNPNVHQGAYKLVEWEYLDGSNWFLMDSNARRRSLFWIDRIPLEFAFAEDLDTLVAKWRAYMRYANAHRNWRFVLGALVS
jgi:phage major head subunit gpT-like protein